MVLLWITVWNLVGNAVFCLDFYIVFQVFCITIRDTVVHVFSGCLDSVLNEFISYSWTCVGVFHDVAHVNDIDCCWYGRGCHTDGDKQNKVTQKHESDDDIHVFFLMSGYTNRAEVQTKRMVRTAVMKKLIYTQDFSCALDWLQHLLFIIETNQHGNFFITVGRKNFGTQWFYWYHQCNKNKNHSTSSTMQGNT